MRSFVGFASSQTEAGHRPAPLTLKKLLHQTVQELFLSEKNCHFEAATDEPGAAIRLYRILRPSR